MQNSAEVKKIKCKHEKDTLTRFKILTSVNPLTIKFKIKFNNKVEVKVKITIKFVVLTFQIIDQ